LYLETIVAGFVMTQTRENSRPYGGTSADDRRADRQARLLAAGTKLYGEKGFGTVGVRAVCKEAGLSERYFYEAFDDGEALLIAALTATATRVEGVLEVAAAQASTPPEKIDAALAAFFSLLREHPVQGRLFLRELDGVSERVDEARREVLRSFVGLFDRLTLGSTSGSLLGVGVVGGVLQIALAWMHCEFRQPLNDVVADARRLCAVAWPLASETLQ
jgi:AcrR family transcriptional regulator